MKLSPAETQQTRRREGLNIHKSCDPKPPLHQKSALNFPEPPNHPGHQISNNDQITHANTKTLDRNRRIKYHRRIRICHLTQRKEGTRAPIQIPRTAGLQVKAKTRGQASPQDDESAESSTHGGEGVWHGEYAGADDCIKEVDYGGCP